MLSIVIVLLSLSSPPALVFPHGLLARGDRHTQQPKPGLPIDQWITKPTAITLTADQTTKFDRLRVEYRSERQGILGPGGGGSDMMIVIKLRDLDTKYRKLVRALLSATQQATYDKNLEALSVPLPKSPS